MNDLRIQDILAEYIDGFLQNQLRVDDLITKYNIMPGSDLEALLRLAEKLESVLIQVQPSSQFVNQLRQELVGEADMITVLTRLRQLSSLQVAAGIAGISGITVAAGVGVFLWVRRMSRRNLTVEEAALAS